MLEPLAADSETKELLSALEQADFDGNLLQSGQALALNLLRINTDFRINERIFRDRLASRPDLEMQLTDR